MIESVIKIYHFKELRYLQLSSVGKKIKIDKLASTLELIEKKIEEVVPKNHSKYQDYFLKSFKKFIKIVNCFKNIKSFQAQIRTLKNDLKTTIEEEDTKNINEKLNDNLKKLQTSINNLNIIKSKL